MRGLLGIVALFAIGLAGCGNDGKKNEPAPRNECGCPNGPRGDCRPQPCPPPLPAPVPAPDLVKLTGAPAEILYDLFRRSGAEPSCEQADLCELALEQARCEGKGTPKRYSCELRLLGGRTSGAPSSVEAGMVYRVLTKEGTLREACERDTCRVETFQPRCKENATGARTVFECSFNRKKPE